MSKQKLHEELNQEFAKDQVLTSPGELACYSYDSGVFSVLNLVEPDAVVLAKSVDDVVKTLKIARELKVPVIPRGAASGQAGGAVASSGGICLDLSSWRDIKIYKEDFQVVVRPGVAIAELNKALAPYELYLPPDPSSGSVCTIGGMVANNSAGQRSLKYGAMNDYVLGLEVVLATGEVITVGGEHSRTIKSVSGLDLKNGLFIGSEGILGVITSIRLKVVSIPPARAGIFVLASNSKDIPKLVRDIYEAKAVLSACEFVYVQESAENDVKNNLGEVPLPEHLEMVLLVEFEGNPASVAWELEVAKEIISQLKGTYVVADNKEDIEHLWLLLDEAEGGVTISRPGSKRIPGGEDLVVPPSRLVDAIEGLQALVKKAGISCVNFGHAAMGNIHTGLLVNYDDEEEMNKVKELVTESHLLALSLNGASTGEHGTGLLRRDLLEKEHGKAVNIMKSIKDVLDPDNILNPGKVLEDRR